MERIEMDKITQNLPTKSAKIRALDQAGVPRARIADYLNIRYQHVRNVLVAVVQGPPADKPVLAVETPATPKEGGLTIEQAKLGLAAHFQVPVDSIEITIRG